MEKKLNPNPLVYILLISLACGCVNSPTEQSATTTMVKITSTTTTSPTTSTTTSSTTTTSSSTTSTSTSTTTMQTTTTTSLQSIPSTTVKNISCSDVQNPGPRACSEAVCQSGGTCTYRPAGGGCCGLPPICYCK